MKNSVLINVLEPKMENMTIEKDIFSDRQFPSLRLEESILNVIFDNVMGPSS